MLPTVYHSLIARPMSYQSSTTNSGQDIHTSDGAKRPPKKYVDPGVTPAVQMPLVKRLCSIFVSPILHWAFGDAPKIRQQLQAAGDPPPDRQQIGGKGMFLHRMQGIGLDVPPFQCVTTRVMKALEQHPLDIQRLAPYLSGITDEPFTAASLSDIRAYLNTLPPSGQAKRADWLAGLGKFVASNDFYQQVKDSEAAKHIRALRDRLSTSRPVIVRSSGINEDNYGDVRAGKYLSEVQGDDDVVRTCLKVMASGYRPELSTSQPMALIIQQCIDCKFGGVAMSYQSPEDNTTGVEFTSGQPRGVVGGQSGNTPHRIHIDRQAGAGKAQYIPGTITSHFILRKNADNNGYSEIAMDADAQSSGSEQPLSDLLVEKLKDAVTRLEDLLLCPVDVEFAIDHQGRLFLLQVRPLTRLSGGMDFAMPIPEETLASGEGVSEGYCTGTLWLANNQATDTMPKGAIVVAQHAEDWMLEPDFLKRAGGFVVVAGGKNDHVGINLRQKTKPLMIAGGQYPAVAALIGQQATLACARFNGKPGAFIVPGDLTGKLCCHRSLSSTFSDVPLVKAVPSRDDLSLPEGSLHQVARAFHWLTDQNARLLALFAPDGGLGCLAHPIKLSMSPQRLQLVAATRDSINRLIHGAEALLGGYHAFLLLAGDSSSDQVKSLLAELPLLSTRFKMLKQTITSRVKMLIDPLCAGEAQPLSEGMFALWLAACHQLQSCLQALNPREAEQVRSVHELIFALHKRFVEALGPVTLDSRQGKISNEGCITYIDCTNPGGSGVEIPLLNPSIKDALNNLAKSGTVVSMDDALIVNLVLGTHVCVIELLEQAEGGKERILRLKVSDCFEKPDGSDKPGKLKRMWFLVQFLKAVELDIDADAMKLSCNAVAGDIIVECPRMTSRPAMQKAFEKLLTVSGAMGDVDLYFEGLPIVEGDQWSFNLLAQRLNNDFTEEANRFVFNHCLFSLIYWRKGNIGRCLRFLNEYHKKFIDYVQQLVICVRGPVDLSQAMFKNDTIDKDTRRKLLHHLLLSGYKNATSLFGLVYDDLRDQDFLIEPAYSYRPVFKVPPGHKEKLRKVLLEQGLQYASQRVRNDKDLVLPTVAKHPDDLQCVSLKLKNDIDVVMTAIAQQGELQQYATPALKDNVDVARTVVAKSPSAMFPASERIQSDKNIIEILIAGDINLLGFLRGKILNDFDYMLDLIEYNSAAFEFADGLLKNDRVFIRSAIVRNSEVRKYISNEQLVESARLQPTIQPESLQINAPAIQSPGPVFLYSGFPQVFSPNSDFSFSARALPNLRGPALLPNYLHPDPLFYPLPFQQPGHILHVIVYFWLSIQLLR
ncbi:PEP/pyruvate-binding domain-containing protein [Endozoicomonas sp. ONNA2]|uniref:PEP/pyruvate-binding domain-containing protein n=1 Tax=Endozoicomonas sp. ONNA2 TaxID=2828741 RepID=UPI002147D257|nr:PEP/pyruvate-binding domain-containing protein [Endozoicomonas sp. ONNA2]